MKRLAYVFGVAAAALLLSSCGVLTLLKMRADRMESHRIESLQLGAIDERITVAVHNGNKKAVTFSSGQIELRVGDRTVGVATLREAVVVEPGSSRVDLPVRIRLPHEGWRSLLSLALSTLREDDGPARRDIRVVGTIGIEKGRKRMTVRFKRRIDEQTLIDAGKTLIGSADSNQS